MTKKFPADFADEMFYVPVGAVENVQAVSPPSFRDELFVPGTDDSQSGVALRLPPHSKTTSELVSLSAHRFASWSAVAGGEQG